MTSAKETHLLANTLSGLLKQCEGSVTTIELRNEAHVTGRITQVDGFMNVHMREAVFSDPMGNKKDFSHFFLQNRLIRYAQIPSTIDISFKLNCLYFLRTLFQMDDGDGASMNPNYTPLGRGRGRGRGRGGRNEVALSGGRKKILKLKEKRRQEDLKNALKMKESLKAQKEEKEKDKKSE